ncbi:MAG: ABC transporter ATP-binding protein [Candidatus Eisenbacteria bacterium]|nr:ABC transporter ATP-binding protein [Candidatus Eisenbacteria bacterium]
MSSAEAPALLVENVVKTYRGGTVRALDGVSLSVERGETLGIIGPNGAGKTTLLGCLLGFLRPDSGTVTVDGHAPDDLAVRAYTGYLPERLVLDRWMSGTEFLEYHHALAKLDAATRAADCAAALERVGLDRAAGLQRIGKYSRGMLQRLGLAQALLGSPKLLFLDEPISGVDPAGVLLFRKLLAEMSAQGVTILVNSHQLAEVERVCSRVVFVKKGRIEAMETVRAGAASARVLRARFAAHAPWPPPREGETPSALLARIATECDATWLEYTAPDARFRVNDDLGATRLLSALLAAGLPLIEAAPDEGRLERLFAPGAEVRS